MSGVKRLRSVAHSLAQHAISGMSSGTPERSLEQRRIGIERISVSLLGEVAEPNALSHDSPALRAKFLELLSKEGVDAAFIVSVRADFEYIGQCRTPDSCSVTIRTENGKEIESKVGASNQ
jgi:hypothetical protein